MPQARCRWELEGPDSPMSPLLTRLRPVQSLMLAKAKECWEQELEEREAEKSRYLAERIPTLQTRGLSLSALQVSLALGWGWGWGREPLWGGCHGPGARV